jgi:hypothetical protein
MKLGQTTTVPGGRSCQRPLCPNIELTNAGAGKPRYQSRIMAKRMLYLCDECFERLSVLQLYELFRRFGVPVGSDRPLAAPLHNRAAARRSAGSS